MFLRGLNYYYLVTFFKNIPLITKFYEKTEEYFPTQANSEDVWNQIYADFTEAASLLPVSYDAANKGRATKGAALAFLGKSYLFNQRWTDAATQLKAAMDLNIYGLVNNSADNFTESNENNVESIFEIQFSRDIGGTTLGWVSSPAAARRPGGCT